MPTECTEMLDPSVCRIPSQESVVHREAFSRDGILQGCISTLKEAGLSWEAPSKAKLIVTTEDWHRATQAAA